jgi:hypothetical protein
MKKTLAVLLLVFSLTACVTWSRPSSAIEEQKVRSTLDDFHLAASAADEDRYFRHFAADGAFLGTDAAERWTVEEFRAYAHPYFSKGKGWTFTPTRRNVSLSRPGDVAWFDEVLDSASFGECRGTGVLQKRAGVWLIEQYNLTIPIPNDLAKEFVERIREMRKK